METSKLLRAKLESLVPGAVLESKRASHLGGGASFWIEMQAILRISESIKNDPELLMDWLENLSVAQVGDALVFTYFVRSSASGQAMVLRGSLILPPEDQEVESLSVVSVWPMAQLMEQEVSDLFGVRFKGDKKYDQRVLLPKGWSGFPLRKKYVFPSEFAGVLHSRSKGRTS